MKMDLNEAIDRLTNAGLIVEDAEDKGQELADFLKSHGFRHKPYSIFGLYKPIRRSPFEFFAMFGMGKCKITLSYWDWDNNKRAVTDRIEVNYNEDPDAFKKIEEFLEKNKKPSK